MPDLAEASKTAWPPRVMYFNSFRFISRTAPFVCRSERSPPVGKFSAQDQTCARPPFCTDCQSMRTTRSRSGLQFLWAISELRRSPRQHTHTLGLCTIANEVVGNTIERKWTTIAWGQPPLCHYRCHYAMSEGDGGGEGFHLRCRSWSAATGGRRDSGARESSRFGVGPRK